MINLPKLSLFLFISLLTVSNSNAGVVIGGTRLVYDGQKKESSINVSNPEKKRPYLIQSWVENYDESDRTKSPFIITPPLFRLDPGQENVIRLVDIGTTLPRDKESVYWLNIKSIPSSKENNENTLLISVKSKIKLFYRPVGLDGSPEDSYKKISFSKKNGYLIIRNDSSYHVSFNKLEADGHEVSDVNMLAPKSEKTYKLPNVGASVIKWSAINDYGGLTSIMDAKI